MNIRFKILISWALILIIAVMTLSYWTTTIITENEETNLQNYLDSVLSTVHDSVDHYHQLLEKNNISSIPSYVTQYQQTAIEGFKNLNFYWSGWLTIFNEQGDIIYTSDNQQSAHYSALWNQMQQIIDKGQISGTQHGGSEDLVFSAFSYEPWNWYVTASASSDALSDSVEQIQRSIFLWSIFTLALSFLLIFWAVNRLLFVPIEKIRNAARNLAEKDYITHIPIETQDVFGKLARDMEILSSRLQEHEQRLVQTNIELEERIEERTQELREKTERLEDENRAHKKTETALREQENQYKNIIKYSPDAIFINFNDKVLIANDACVELFGADNPEQLIGRNIYDCFHPDYRSFVQDRVKILREEQKPVEIASEKILRLDGKPVDVEVTAAPFPYKDSVAIHVILRDVTGKRELEAQLRQALKMDAIGRLAGGVAHDFNNMLGVILGYSEIILDQIDDTFQYSDYIKEIQKAAESSASLTQQLLAFARKQAAQPKHLDINAKIEHMLNMLKRLIGENIELIWEPGQVSGMILIDPSQLDQILINLCVNAREAIENVGHITIETSEVTLDEEYCNTHVDCKPGAYVRLAVSDDGCGMDSEALSMVFEPFFTTKDTNSGTGLGLATVFGIVRQNGGGIHVYSELGFGTTFTIYLQCQDAVEKQVSKENPIQEATYEREVILLVDDNDMVRNVTYKMLEGIGCQVVSASTPSEAIEICSSRSDITLLLTDVIMPEMNGRELYNRLLQDNPSLKCLYMSGYTSNVIVHSGVIDEGVGFLQKPFDRVALTEKIQEIFTGENT